MLDDEFASSSTSFDCLQDIFPSLDHSAEPDPPPLSQPASSSLSFSSLFDSPQTPQLSWSGQVSPNLLAGNVNDPLANLDFIATHELQDALTFPGAGEPMAVDGQYYAPLNNLSRFGSQEDNTYSEWISSFHEISPFQSQGASNPPSLIPSSHPDDFLPIDYSLTQSQGISAPPIQFVLYDPPPVS
ncbi:hypothetical protein JAAARDRAFT_200550 [Jaapia argillacea MUCL 33604]|uniref:Uncharacterized protein n=1 Tax=Jaapia argillacea MUCL 33604 TaxID=933084 RepID=A0A067PFK4_9AGAM|nr:hypothetical protein JAAARDRAFT_200550 [Jaapia argillacea MUCL 33604]